jgi:hypothetical protein
MADVNKVLSCSPASAHKIVTRPAVINVISTQPA